MSLTLQGPELEIELQRVMHEIALSLLGEPELASGTGGAKETAERLACRVGIHGGFEGQVVVNATFGVAAQLAEKMFGDDLTGPPTRRDAQDALREVANIVAGNLKPLFGEDNNLGLPEDLPENTHVAGGSLLAEVNARHASGVLEVYVYANANLPV